MFLKDKLFFIFIIFLSYSSISSSEEVCRRELTLDTAKEKVAESKKKYNIVKVDNYKTFMKPTNGECHYYFLEKHESDIHLNRYYFLDNNGEVLYIGQRVPFRPGTFKCPDMPLGDEFFYKVVKAHSSTNKRQINFSKSRSRKLRCLYLYSAEFDDGRIPSSINYTFDYKGRMIKWLRVNEEWKKEEREYDTKQKELKK